MSIEIVKDDSSYDDQIYNVVSSAFKQEDEAILVNRIKEESNFYISFIALDKDKVVGHIMVSPMLLNEEQIVLALAPVSVLEKYANQGIGGMLIKKALSEASKYPEYKFITVLGSDHYYNRFGFESYNPKQFSIPFDIDERFFQMLEIEKECLANLNGELAYPEYFNL